MSENQTKYEEYLERVKASGGKVLPLTTPCCDTQMEVPAPTEEGETWDAVTMCPYCSQLFLKVVTATEATGNLPRFVKPVEDE